MRSILLTLLMAASFQSVLADTDDRCVDRRAALIAPCGEEMTRFFNQGTCSESYEFQNTYCAKEEMTNIETIIGEVEVALESVGGYDVVLLHAAGQMLRPRQGLVKSCLNAKVLIGKSKESVDNYDPSKGEYGIASEIISFSCRD